MKIEKVQRIIATASTDAGPRNNEDNAFVKVNKKTGIVAAAIADGVGGLEKGELASKYITKAIKKWFEDNSETFLTMQFSDLKQSMINVTMDIHEQLLDISFEKEMQFGSTLTFVIAGKSKYCIVQVGDSRAYLHDCKWVTQLTKDQTLAEYEKETGEIRLDIPNHRKAHTLLQCMGRGEINPEVYEGVLPLEYDLLLCSDGLSNTLTEKDIKEELKKDISCTDTLINLIHLARKREEQDNITGIIIRRRNSAEQ